MMYIKFTPDQPSRILINSAYVLHNHVVDILGDIQQSQIVASTIYTKTTKEGHLLYALYSVLELSVELYASGVDIISVMIRKLHNMWTVESQILKMFSEFVHASKEYSETELKLRIWNNDSGAFDFLSGNFIFPPVFDNHTTRRCNQTDLILLDRLHVCPIIRLNYTEMNIKIVDETFLLINESYVREVIPKWEYRADNVSVLICLSQFISIYNSMSKSITSVEPDAKEVVIGLKQYLSFGCVCLSLTCLLVTIVTYIKTAELQSQPGINTIILCITLLLAQAMYQFGAGQTSLPHWACALVGAVCHFLWLAVMFAMNACSIDMFLVFRKLEKLAPKYNSIHTGKIVLYIVATSLVFICLNIFVSVTVSQGQDNGYGGKLCYLSTTMMHLITFIVPSFCTIFVNIVLFVCVVFMINKTAIKSTDLNTERNYFAIYMRLSTLTGVTWLVGFLDLLINNEILEYLFIILNASQGFFIMTAFVFNKRVHKVCCKKLKEDQMSNATSGLI